MERSRPLHKILLVIMIILFGTLLSTNVLKAEAADVACRIDFDANGGVLESKNWTTWYYTFESSNPVNWSIYSSDNPTKDGYVFAGWKATTPNTVFHNGEDIYDKVVQPGQEFTIYDGATFEAVWRSPSGESDNFTINIDLNGGTGKSQFIYSKTSNINHLYATGEGFYLSNFSLLTNYISKDGYYIYGFENLDNGERYILDLQLYGDIIHGEDEANLKVLWCENGKVPVEYYSPEEPIDVCNLCDGMDNYKLIDVQFVEKGTTTNMLTLPDKRIGDMHYRLIGWNKYNETISYKNTLNSFNRLRYSYIKSEYLFDFNKPITGYLKLFPIYYSLIDVSFDLQGGTLDGYTGTYDTCIYADTTISSIASGNLSGFIPEKEDSRFLGWKVTTEGKVNMGIITSDQYNKTVKTTDSLTIKSGATFEAVYGPKQYEVTLIANGGYFGNKSVTSKVVLIDEGTELSGNYNVSYDGKRCLGWYTEAEGGEKFESPVTEDITLYAHWVNQYRIILDINATNGHFGTSVNVKTFSKYKDEGELFGEFKTLMNGTTYVDRTPMNSGYTLGGWYTEPEGGEKFDLDNTPITENLTLYAHWQSYFSFYITDNNGSSKLLEYKYVDIGDTVEPIEQSSVPEREGYKFIGWYTSRTGGVEFDFDTPITQNKAVYAHYEQTIFTVTLRSNVTYYQGAFIINDSRASSASVKVETGDKLTEEKINSVIDKIEDMYGRIFNGWYTASTNGEEFDFDTPITKDIVLYAYWRDPNYYTINLYGNGGNIRYYGSTYEDKSITAREGYAVDANDNISVSKQRNYVQSIFEGWYTKAEGGKEFDIKNTPVTSDMELYAHWKDYYKVTLDSNGYNVGNPYPDGKYVVVLEGETAPKPTITVDTYYPLKGWYTEASGGKKFNFDTPITEDITLYAHWGTGNETIYQVTFNPNDNEESPSSWNNESRSEDVYEEETAPELSISRPGYTFTGWYTEDGEKFNFDTIVTSDMTLTAQWKKAATTPDGQLSGNTLTMFEVDNPQLDTDKPDDVLGGDLVVSVPAELRLAYTEDKKIFTKDDKVYAVGRTHVSDILKIATDENIWYVSDDATPELLEQFPEAKVKGVIAFGEQEDNKQVSQWLASELLQGVFKHSVEEGVGKDISSTVQKDEVVYTGSYSATIWYNITLHQPNIDRVIDKENTELAPIN